MPGLVPGIHDLLLPIAAKTWMAGTSPAMTVENYFGSMLSRIWRSRGNTSFHAVFLTIANICM